MIKLLIIYNKVWPYREKIFEILNQSFDLTVSFTDPKYLDRKYPFKTLYLPGRNIGPFFIHKNNLNRISKSYDAVIGLYDIRWLQLMLLSLSPFRKYTISYWGIGVTASYKNKFDSQSKWDKVRYFFANQADSILLYSDYPIKKHLKAGVNRNKIFVANNTTEVFFESNTFEPDKKTNFLFVGTLYPQKGFNVLLEAYLRTYQKNENIPNLDIIGDGPEMENIKEIISREKLEGKIFLHGSVYNPKELAKFFSNAIACISPKQAGLSVLTSMGNATIFVTEKNAITGGEIFNISNHVNGILYEEGIGNLIDVMEWITENRAMVVEMSINARKFYEQYRQPEMMAEAIMNAVNFAQQEKK
jgi:glycosyltransferase involved in cell wall biosynthesis